MSKRKINLPSLLHILLLLVFVGTFSGFVAAPNAEAESEVSSVRVERLERGINLPRWLWINRGPIQELEKRFSNHDLNLIQSLGFSHVRIPIDMANACDPEADNLLNAKVMDVLDKGLVKIMQYGLGIIIDLHSISQATGGSNYSGDLGKDEEVTNRFIEFWGHFAKHLSKHDPDWVILEPMNEPVFRGFEDKWPKIQKRVIDVIRRNAPEHSIIATGTHWSNLDSLLEMEPLDDPNIIYNFHFYEPHIFTHQGATWSSDLVKPLRNIPYPSSPLFIEEVVDRYEQSNVKNALKRYGQEWWNAEKIDEEIGKAGEWSKEHGVPVICDEFGVYRSYSQPKHRVQWIHDVRVAFEKHDIGWCMWNYDGGFGIVDEEDGKNVVDVHTAKALGLNVD